MGLELHDVVSYIVMRNLIEKLEKKHFILPGALLIMSSVLLNLKLYLYLKLNVNDFFIVDAVTNLTFGALLVLAGLLLFSVSFRVGRLGFVFFSVLSLILLGILFMLIPVFYLFTKMSLFRILTLESNDIPNNFLAFIIIFSILSVIYSIPSLIENFSYVFNRLRRQKISIGTNVITYLLLLYLLFAPSISEKLGLVINIFLLVMMDFLLLLSGITLFYYSRKIGNLKLCLLSI